MEQSSLFGDGVDIDTETPASADATAPADAMLDAPEITDAAFDKMLV